MENSTDLVLGYSNTGLEWQQELAVLYSMTGFGIMAGFIGYRIGKAPKKNSNSDLTQSVNVSRALTLAVMTTSCTFCLFSVMLLLLQQGNTAACTITIYGCIFFYFIPKNFFYLLLVEKVHLVRDGQLERKKSKLWKVNICLILSYSIPGTFAFASMLSELQPDGKCETGIKSAAGGLYLAFDTIFSVYLTLLFVSPIFKAMDPSAPQGADRKGTVNKLKIVARKSLIGGIITLISTFINTLAVVATPLRWSVVCISFCTTDIFVNASVAHWLTPPISNYEKRQRISPEKSFRKSSSTLDVSSGSTLNGV